VLYLALQGYLAKGLEGPPLLREVNSLRVFDRVMTFLSFRAARATLSALGTRRLQPQLFILVCVALLAAAWPISQRGLHFGAGTSAVDPVFALLWLLGIVCAVGAARQAKFHRLAALIQMGAAGLVT